MVFSDWHEFDTTSRLATEARERRQVRDLRRKARAGSGQSNTLPEMRAQTQPPTEIAL
jgi:hypothetical protein